MSLTLSWNGWLFEKPRGYTKNTDVLSLALGFPIGKILNTRLILWVLILGSLLWRHMPVIAWLLKKIALQSLRWQETWVRSRSLFSYLYPPLPLPSLPTLFFAGKTIWKGPLPPKVLIFPGARDGRRPSTSGGGRLHANPRRVGDARTTGDARQLRMGLMNVPTKTAL